MPIRSLIFQTWLLKGTGTPEDPFNSLTVLGDFYIPETGTDSDPVYTTQIIFRGDTLPTAIVSATNENTILVNNTFLGNPVIQAYTPPKSPSRLDGGSSNLKKPSDQELITVTITSQDVHKKFGAVMPAYSSTFQYCNSQR